jgi:hypothetical protein
MLSQAEDYTTDEPLLVAGWDQCSDHEMSSLLLGSLLFPISTILDL